MGFSNIWKYQNTQWSGIKLVAYADDPLDVAEVITSDWFKLEGPLAFKVNVRADAIGELTVLHSNDGVTIEDTEGVSVAAGSLTSITQALTMPYVAIQYSNGAVAQTEFSCFIYACSSDAATDPSTVKPTLVHTDASSTVGARLIDEAGHAAHSIQDINGDWHIGVHSIQKLIPVSANSSTANLKAKGSLPANSDKFIGTMTSSAGANSILVNLKTDVNCLVHIQQSPDGTHWDISDTYNYYYSLNNFGITVKVVSSFFRILIENIDPNDSTYFRLQSLICPVSEPLPRSLDENGHLQTAVHGITDEYGFEIENTPNGEMRVVAPTLLVGKTFDGDTLDNNFWSTFTTASGTVAIADGQCTLTTGATISGTAELVSVRRARYVPGQSHVARFQLQLSDTGAAGNVRRWGVGWSSTLLSNGVVTDGAFFVLSGTTFQVEITKGGVATVISSGAFNGKYGATYNLDTKVKTCEIYWNNKGVYFTVEGEILHLFTADLAPFANTVQFHLVMQTSNTGISTLHNLQCRAAGIRRLGSLLSQPTSKYQAGTTNGVVLKHGAGNIHRVAVSGITNNSVVTLYDNTAASGTVVWSTGAMVIQNQSNNLPFFIDFGGLPFFNGLCLVISGANCNALVVYE